MNALCLTATSFMQPELPAASSDDETVRAAVAGDRKAFEVLYRRHADRVYGAVLRLAAFDHARAEDLTQEAFVRAWQKLEGFRFESSFGTWVYRLAVNVALMSIRARNADPVTILDDEHLPDITDIDNPVRAFERDELEKAIAALPPRARAVLVLHDVEGWKHEEIATELSMAVGSSKAQLHRARGLLRRVLGDKP
ncbi:RNA polymerase sigma-70 factor, ECF subfamily [Luteibacter sp. UNC138MFCol5.1]|nr:RNA polymerase sigma-70 factor (ECF subfamily) [Luteibacter sp. 3190]SEP11211.1 RNA polymerase sigma-70 factor, ECF subfamily [Luteibacter sp. UNC138MFCol5.1]SEW04696.1 RNA polymerase sigma-70 factor, ECF subfamily [Luteibacter sp. 329MFSha]